ncbi:MAG: response regulator transcription factor [Clostridium sp.]|nr:response regulator transcription factor [Clostridium sp.]
MSRILIVEDDREIIKHLSILLKEEGFSVRAECSRAAALGAFRREAFDLVLLDITLPDGNGYSLCTAMKRIKEIPVIFLTATGDEASTVTGFDLGADDYIVKPFRPLELISRIKNALRRYGKGSSVCWLSGIKVDMAKAEVTRDGREIFLSALEYRLLLVFLNHRGEVLSRGRLLEEIWDIAGEFVNDNTLTVYIKRLRDKIEAEPENPVIIKTVRGLGYKAGD